jgi:hypothetical protein
VCVNQTCLTTWSIIRATLFLFIYEEGFQAICISNSLRQEPRQDQLPLKYLINSFSHTDFLRTSFKSRSAGLRAFCTTLDPSSDAETRRQLPPDIRDLFDEAVSLRDELRSRLDNLSLVPQKCQYVIRIVEEMLGKLAASPLSALRSPLSALHSPLSTLHSPLSTLHSHNIVF